ncbi:NAD(P)-dependent oxidoreductase [Acuticoccus sp. I52.16.1]|uniref:NAD-dependent epimerase/dehydratase family protein n=1 Tax=Acuticoccus sp. I52.16.1 TaxID=2928472 RepID=UPI001FD216EC|nr:NAD(P)-dependent oxidoreductase [Acuticoccus sp. I52.16.1]UOM37358.1 NAD(P)-dependent oxidoreductase [Acuticoccus sp. I52.16.1]
MTKEMTGGPTGGTTGGMRKAVVTGGSGFLGSHVADAFSAAGYAVGVYDVRPSPHLGAGQTMTTGDLADVDALAAAFEGADVVAHFAGIADIGAANVDPVRTAHVNLVGTVNTLEAAVRAGVKRYLFASTVYVYSDMGGFYRASKQACEAFVETFSQERGLPFTILRYGTLYGRRSGGTNRIHSMVTSAIRDKAIAYPGSGEALRDVIHARDAATLTVRTLAPEYADAHLLITGQERVRVKDIARMIAEIVPGPIALDFKDGEPEGHYMLTPYSFAPRLSKKLVPTEYIDIGQGLYDCIQEAWDAAHPQEPTYLPGSGKSRDGTS